jgi:dihydroneopterin aldolase
VPDVILVEGIRVAAALGVTHGERVLRRPVLIDLRLERDLSRAGASDRLAHTIDYARVYQLVEKVASGREHRLVEALAERIASALLDELPIERCSVSVRKQAPLSGPVAFAGVSIERTRSGDG